MRKDNVYLINDTQGKKMKFEKLGTNYAKFTFEVTPEIFEHGLDHSFDSVKEKIEVKGFRKGHVPRNIYETKFGVESLYEEALNHVIGHFYKEVFTEKSVVIVGEPKVDVDVKTINREKPFKLSLTFPIKPEVLLGEYLGAKAKKLDLEVKEEEINQELERLLSQNSQLVPKDGENLEKGDTAIFDFEGFVDDKPFEGGKAENYQLKIGSNQFIPGFEDGMIGLKAGEQKDINVVFPKEYQEASLAGKEAIFKVKLHEIKIETKQELTDEFVLSLKKENVDTVDKLKQSITQELTASKEKSEETRVTGTAIKFAVSNAKVDIPIEMIEHEKKNMRKSIEEQAKQYGIEFSMYIQFSGLTMEQFEAEIGRQAQDRVLTSLVIDAIAQKENLPVSKEDIEKKYDEIATHYNIDKKEVKKQLSKDVMTNEVRFDKTIEYLKNNVEFSEEE